MVTCAGGSLNSIIDTHRHVYGPKLRQKFIDNLGRDDSKPLPQANDAEQFFYCETVVALLIRWRFSGKVEFRSA